MRTIDESLMKLAVAYYYYSCTHSLDKMSIDDDCLDQLNLYIAANKASFAIDSADERKYGIGGSTSMLSGEVRKMVNNIIDEGIESVLFRESELETHPQKGLIKRFYILLPKLIRLQENNPGLYSRFDGNMCHFGICFSEFDSELFRFRYHIGIGENILFVSERGRNNFFGNWKYSCGLAFTDLGIYKRYSGDEPLSLKWNEFNNVKYIEGFFNFYLDKKLVTQIGKAYFGLSKSTASECVEVAKGLTDVANVPDPIELAKKCHFEDAIKNAESIIKAGEDVPFGHFAKAMVLLMMEHDKIEKNPTYEKSDEIKSNLQSVLKVFRRAIIEKESTNDDDKPEFVAHTMLCIADAENLMGRYYASREHYIEGLENCNEDEKESSMEALISVEKSLQETWDNYTTQYKYKDRKFIMPIRDNEIGGCIADGITTFRMSNIPSCMKFPSGHPIANQLYIGHPFNSSLYVPYDDSEELFFLDKVHELRYLLECLGAEEITITSIKGKEVNEFRDEASRYAVDAEIKRFSAGVEINTQYKNQNDSSSHSHRSMIVKLDPMQKPFLPDGLIWYNEMPQWQRLVQSRLHGNLLEYSEFVSTAETKFTSSSEMTDIKASAKFLWAKAHAEVNECYEKQFRESTETQWKVDVKFRSMKGFEDQMIDAIEDEGAEPLNQIGWSKEEEDYAEEVKFCLEDDGVIDDSERRLLERKRIKFGISQKRAAEIEKSLLQSQLTEDEQEYLEAVKEELVGGKIPEASRRLLERLRKRMDVSEERAKEIETMAMKR